MKVGSPPATGTELVALLEALSGAAELSHDELSDQSIDDHHNKTHKTDHVDGTDDIRNATASVKGLATAAQITQLDAHKSRHVDGSDDIRDATASVKGLATATQIAKLDLNDADTLEGYSAIDLMAPPLTLAQFQANAATGDVNDPERLNDNSTGTFISTSSVGKYAEVDLVGAYAITQYRCFGENATNVDGEWAIQYWDGDSWQDWETGIPTRYANWSDWVAPAAGIKATQKLRLVCTVVDSWGASNMGELEVKY